MIIDFFYFGPLIKNKDLWEKGSHERKEKIGNRKWQGGEIAKWTPVITINKLGISEILKGIIYDCLG